MSSLKRRATKLVAALNALEGVRCDHIYHILYRGLTRAYLVLPLPLPLTLPLTLTPDP